MNKILESGSIIIYRLLDWLKQESPFWFFVVQSVIWGMILIIYKEWVPLYGYKEVALTLLLSLTSGVGTRTTKKLSEQASSVSADSFRQGFQKAEQELKQDQQKFKLEPIEPVEYIKPVESLNIVPRFLTKGQWIQEKVSKTQIVLHHSVSSSVDSIISSWNSTKDRVGTAYSIDKDGTIYQHFPDDEWGYHLYVDASSNKVDKKYKLRDKILNQQSIGIELVSMGGLTKKGGKWYTIYNTTIPEENVEQINYRGFKGFDKYTPPQLDSAKILIKHLSEKYSIPINPLTFNISLEALTSKPGLYTHSNFRTDKSDCYPSVDLQKQTTEK